MLKTQEKNGISVKIACKDGQQNWMEAKKLRSITEKKIKLL